MSKLNHCTNNREEPLLQLHVRASCFCHLRKQISAWLDLNSSLNTINSLGGPTPESEHYSEVSRVIQLSTFSIAVRHVQEGVGWAITNQEDAISETPPNSSSSLSSYNSSSSFLFSWTSHLLKCRTRHCRDKNVFPHLRISTEKFQNGRVT